jgi:hypothetical protein
MFKFMGQNIDAALINKIEEEIRVKAPYRLPNRRLLQRMPLSFYGGDGGYQLVSLRDLDIPPPNEKFLLFKSGAPAVFLDWTGGPIYELNDTLGALQLRRKVLIDYTKFFFHFVRNQPGRFIFISSLDEMPWRPGIAASEREQAKEHARAALAKAGEEFKDTNDLSLKYIGHEANDFYKLRGIVVFKHALFQTDVLIAPYPVNRHGEEGPSRITTGQVELFNGFLLDENFPVSIDGPPGEFG